MSNPDDTVERKKIYDVYDALITPLIKEAKADIEQFNRAKEGVLKRIKTLLTHKQYSVK